MLKNKKVMTPQKTQTVLSSLSEKLKALGFFFVENKDKMKTEIR